MTADWRKNLLSSLLFLLIGLVGAITLDQLTDWSDWLKLVPIIIFLVVAVVTLLDKGAATTGPPNPAATPTPSPAAPSATTPPVPPGRGNQVVTDSAFTNIICFILGLLLLGGMAYLGIRLYKAIMSEADSIVAEAKVKQTRVNEFFPIGHSYRQKPDKEYDKWIEAGQIYDVFDLAEEQHWKWYLDADIEARVMSTGDEKFDKFERWKDTGSEHVARHAGLLQVRTDRPYTHVRIKRLVPFENHQ